MNFPELAKRLHRDLYDASDRGALQRIGRTLERAGGLLPLLENNDPALDPFPAAALAPLSEIEREFGAWKVAAKEVRRALDRSGLKLPDRSLELAATPGELAALERTARMCPRSGHSDHDSWAAAVRAHVDLWRSAVSLGMAEGRATITVVDAQHPEAEELGIHVGEGLPLDDIPGYRWLGARRGERAGVLAIELELPLAAIEAQAEARMSALGLMAQRRGATAVVEELVTNNLQAALLHLLDVRAESEAIATAVTAYQGLLTAPPVKAGPLLALHVGSKATPLGVAVLDRAGDLVAQAEAPPDAELAPVLAPLIDEHEPNAAALPTTSPDAERLRAAEAALGDLPLTRVHPAALREAREKLSFPAPVASALVLGRRALRPAREWSRVEPASLGLGEYSRDLDPEKLSRALIEARQIAAWERRQRKSKRPRAQSGRYGAAAARAKPLNPLVKTIRDLKAGMTVDGVVTNLTRFGAFVNIGLSTEAMIHVSQLSTDFVEEPSQVVRVGQQVSARVLEVVPEKSRIALTLKPPPERGDRADGPRRPPSSSHSMSRGRPRGKGGDRGGDPVSRSAALADLDALFKKK